MAASSLLHHPLQNVLPDDAVEPASSISRLNHTGFTSTVRPVLSVSSSVSWRLDHHHRGNGVSGPKVPQGQKQVPVDLTVLRSLRVNMRFETG